MSGNISDAFNAVMEFEIHHFTCVLKPRFHFACDGSKTGNGQRLMPTSIEVTIPRRNIRSFLSALDRFRTDHDLTVDEAIIYIALGDLNLAARQTDVLTMRPTSMTMISYQLDIPRETVRRKVKTLLNKGLIRARGRELYLDDLKLWMAIGDQLNGGAQLLRAVA